MTVRTNCYFFSITIEILSTSNIEISTPGGGIFEFWNVPEGGRELSRRAGSRRHAATASYPEPALRVRPPGLLARPRLRPRPGSSRPSPPDRGENGTSTIERYPRKFVPTSPPPLRGLRSGRVGVGTWAWQRLGGVGVAVLEFGKEVKTSVRRRRSRREELPFLQNCKKKKNFFNSGYLGSPLFALTGEAGENKGPA